MTLTDVARLARYWQKNPPPHALLRAIAQFVGVKMPDDDASKPKPMTYEEARMMMRRTGDAGVTTEAIRNMMGNE